VKTRITVQVVAAVVVAVFAVGVLLDGGAVESWWLRAYSVAVLVALLLLFCWDRVLWQWGFFQRFRVVPRDVRGTWKGTLVTQWVDPDTGEVPPPKPAFLVVRQTASSISVVQLTDESRSTSTFGRVTDDGTSASLDYMYLNRPDSRVEHRSRMHHGSTALDLIGRPVTRMKGRYWTSRDSKGELEFAERRATRVEGYLEGLALFAADSEAVTGEEGTGFHRLERATRRKDTRMARVVLEGGDA